MTVLARRFPTAAAFLSAAEPFLLQAEVENNLIFSTARSFAQSDAAPAAHLYFAGAWEDSELLVCAFRRSPEGVGITRATRVEALRPLAVDVCEACPGIEEVFGIEPTVSAFVDLLTDRLDGRTRRRMSQRLFELRAVERLPMPAGDFRAATEGDLELLTSWFDDYLRTLGERGSAKDLALNPIRGGHVFVWEHGRPVSMAAWAGQTPNGVRVNFVYTPPNFRSRGYATACVASLSQQLLDRGNRHCCLYTDLGNPTSNAICQRIGYRPVCDAAVYRLGV